MKDGFRGLGYFSVLYNVFTLINDCLEVTEILTIFAAWK